MDLETTLRLILTRIVNWSPRICLGCEEALPEDGPCLNRACSISQAWAALDLERGACESCGETTSDLYRVCGDCWVRLPS